MHRFTHSNTLFVSDVVLLIHLLIPQMSMEHIDRRATQVWVHLDKMGFFPINTVELQAMWLWNRRYEGQLGTEHPQNLVSPVGPGTNALWIRRDQYPSVGTAPATGLKLILFRKKLLRVSCSVKHVGQHYLKLL